MHAHVHLFDTNCAPPPEPMPSDKSSAALAKSDLVENDTFIIPPCSPSNSASAPTSVSTDPQTLTTLHSNASSVSLCAMQNINLSTTNNGNSLNDHDDAYDDIIINEQKSESIDTTDTIMVDKENNTDSNNNNNNNNDNSNNGGRRRSDRISKKRKLGHVAYYTPKSWAACYQPLKKRRKTNPRKTSSPIQNTNTNNSMNSKSNSNNRIRKKVKVKVIKEKTASQLLSAQNNKMRKIHSEIKKARLSWIKHHYSSFEPFLSDKIRRKLKPKKNQKTIKIQSSKDYIEQPQSLQHGTLRDYQLYSLNWLRNLRNNGVPGILADEMGLGKTIQSIACIASFLQDNNDNNNNNLFDNNKDSPSLIICPLSVAEAWLTEFNKWLPSLKCILFHGPKQQRENLMKYKLVFGLFDICITTYEIATNNKSFLNKFYWNYFILDEAHRIKNEQTNWHHALKNINDHSLYCILLTGTPIQNNMHELWSLLSFIFGTDIFDVESAAIFDSCYQVKGSKTNNNTTNKQLLSKTPYLLNPFFLRRLKCQVELSLPAKEEIIIKIKMSAPQKKYYKTFLFAHSSLIDQVSNVLYNGDKIRGKNQVSAWKKLRSLFTELRKIAMHPFLLRDLSDKICMANASELISHSSKLQLLDKLLARLFKNGHRVLLFSCFTLVLDVLQVYCSYKKYKYLRLDGQTSRIRRKIDIERFNDNPDSQFFIYLISNRAGGLGINLQAADTVIHFDTDWNPQADLQAQARAHRIGQTKMVKIYRLITKNTVEERILFRSQQKLYLDAVVNKGAKMLQDNNDNNEDNNIEFDLENEDLLACIKFGAQKMFDNDNDNENENMELEDIDLDILLERDTHKIKSGNDVSDRKKLLKDLSLENNVRDFNFSAKLSAGNVFEGETYEKREFNYNMDDDDDDDDIDSSEMKRSRSARVGNKSKTVVKEMIVDGLRFSSRIEANPMMKFYQQCGDYIYDSRNTSPWHHELITCWACDQYYTNEELDPDDDDDNDQIIKCQNCPKTFHNNGKCWRGERSKMGIFICSQHSCHKCGMKTSECGMILKCIGCPLSFCYDCSPQPFWKGKDGKDGLYFVDECLIAQHYNYQLPSSTYMYIFCSNQCKDYYQQVYCKRKLPNLSLTYHKLSNTQEYDIKKVIKKSCKRKKKHKHKKWKCKSKHLGNISIDSRIQSYDMANEIIERLKQHFEGDCPIIEKFYDILYLFPISDYDETTNIENNNKQDKDYILGKHFMEIKELNDFANENLCLPQWKQCLKCKKWRVLNMKINQICANINCNIINCNWICSEKDGFDNLCATIQEIQDIKSNYSNNEINILRLQREAMNIQYKFNSKMKVNNENNNNNNHDYKTQLFEIENKMNQIINQYKLESINKLSIINKKHLCQARYIGLSQWNGFILSDCEENDRNKICQYYQHLITQFRHWRIESIKTLMDHLGFLVVSRKKQRGSKQFHVDTIALSYNKEKVIKALAAFLVYPIDDFLQLTTAHFSK